VTKVSKTIDAFAKWANIYQPVLRVLLKPCMTQFCQPETSASLQSFKPTRFESFSTKFTNSAEKPNTQLIYVTWLIVCKLQDLQNNYLIPQAYCFFFCSEICKSLRELKVFPKKSNEPPPLLEKTNCVFAVGGQIFLIQWNPSLQIQYQRFKFLKYKLRRTLFPQIWSWGAPSSDLLYANVWRDRRSRGETKLFPQNINWGPTTSQLEVWDVRNTTMPEAL